MTRAAGLLLALVLLVGCGRVRVDEDPVAVYRVFVPAVAWTCESLCVRQAWLEARVRCRERMLAEHLVQLPTSCDDPLPVDYEE